MKHRIYSLVLCFVLLILAAGAAPAQAQGDGPEGSSPEVRTAASAAITFNHFYLLRADQAPTPWQHTSTLVDRAGGVHTAFFTSQYVHYAYCPGDCGKMTSWSQTALVAAGSYDALDFPTLALDPNNHPRMMWYIDPDYYYAECSASCTNPASWTKVKVPMGPDNDYIYPKSPRYFALDSKGRPRFVTYGSYLDPDYNVFRGLTYNTCDASCTNAANWHSSIIDLGENMYIDQPQLVMNVSDQPRVMGVNSDADGVYKLIYLGCDTNCSLAASWKSVRLYELGMYGNFSFRLDSQGRGRVAFYKEGSSDPNMYYAWTSSTVIGLSGWQVAPINLPTNDPREVDLAIDSQDRPRMVYATDKEDLQYVECTANCTTMVNSTWQTQAIETSAALDTNDPIPLGSGCTVSTWMLEGYPSLALDGRDQPSVSYYARHSKFCLGTDGKYHILHDVWGLRFATAGTGPALGNKKTYLPMLRR